MKWLSASGAVLLVILAAATTPAADSPSRRTPKEALQAFNDLIGSWRGAGVPEGTREEKQKGFWTETLQWSWQFKGDDAWLKVTIEKGKHFTGGELRYLPDKDRFRLTLANTAKQNLVFEGPLQENRLTLDRQDDAQHKTQRLVISLLHDNRFLYRYEVRPPNRTGFTRLYQVGATKEGEAFAAGTTGPECVVSGGLGTIAVTYKGQTYHVCCSGCRDAFKEDPEKYIKEYEQRKKSGKEKKP